MFIRCHLGNSVEKTAVILPHLYIIGLKIVLRVYRAVQLMEYKVMKEMYLINFVNFALLLPLFLNYRQFLDLSFEMVLFR